MLPPECSFCPVYVGSLQIIRLVFLLSRLGWNRAGARAGLGLFWAGAKAVAGAGARAGAGGAGGGAGAGAGAGARLELVWAWAGAGLELEVPACIPGSPAASSPRPGHVGLPTTAHQCRVPGSRLLPKSPAPGWSTSSVL